MVNSMLDRLIETLKLDGKNTVMRNEAIQSYMKRFKKKVKITLK